MADLLQVDNDIPLAKSDEQYVLNMEDETTQWMSANNASLSEDYNNNNNNSEVVSDEGLFYVPTSLVVLLYSASCSRTKSMTVSFTKSMTFGRSCRTLPSDLSFSRITL